MMDRVPVRSSNLVSVGYEPATETLEVEFTSGRVYQYYGVPPGVHEALMTSGSVGGYFNANVRVHYPCSPL